MKLGPISSDEVPLRPAKRYSGNNVSTEAGNCLRFFDPLVIVFTESSACLLPHQCLIRVMRLSGEIVSSPINRQDATYLPFKPCAPQTTSAIRKGMRRIEIHHHCAASTLKWQSPFRGLQDAIRQSIGPGPHVVRMPSPKIELRSQDQIEMAVLWLPRNCSVTVVVVHVDRYVVSIFAK